MPVVEVVVLHKYVVVVVEGCAMDQGWIKFDSQVVITDRLQIILNY